MPELPVVDAFGAEHRDDPWSLYRTLQEESPVFRTPDGAFVLTRYDDCVAVLRDPRSSVSMANLAPEAMTPQTGPYDIDLPVMLFQDPPDHTRLRALVSKAFTPKVMEGMRTHIEQLVDDLLDVVVEEGRMDVLGDLAYPLPVTVICELLGVPVGDRDQFRPWSSAASRLLDGDLGPAVLNEGLVAAMQIINYLNDQVEDRRRHPRHDLLTALVEAEEAGDRLTHEELLATATLLFVAGHETTMNLIGNGTYALLRHPDQVRRLRDDPSLVRDAVEEMLRFDGPVHLTGRITTQDVTLSGVTIPAGFQAVTLLAAANRDPARFDSPDALDVGRRDNHHITFSSGSHFCLGASLARIEGQVVLSGMLRRLEDWELATPEPRYREHFVLRGLQELEMAFSPALSRTR
jgi:pimeloyl-[acyl-carrier protein] synthase